MAPRRPGRAGRKSPAQGDHEADDEAISTQSQDIHDNDESGDTTIQVPQPAKEEDEKPNGRRGGRRKKSAVIADQPVEDDGIVVDTAFANVANERVSQPLIQQAEESILDEGLLGKSKERLRRGGRKSAGAKDGPANDIVTAAQLANLEIGKGTLAAKQNEEQHTSEIVEATPQRRSGRTPRKSLKALTLEEDHIDPSASSVVVAPSHTSEDGQEGQEIVVSSETAPENNSEIIVEENSTRKQGRGGRRKAAAKVASSSNQEQLEVVTQIEAVSISTNNPLSLANQQKNDASNVSTIALQESQPMTSNLPLPATEDAQAVDAQLEETPLKHRARRGKKGTVNASANPYEAIPFDTLTSNLPITDEPIPEVQHQSPNKEAHNTQTEVFENREVPDAAVQRVTPLAGTPVPEDVMDDGVEGGPSSTSKQAPRRKGRRPKSAQKNPGVETSGRGKRKRSDSTDEYGPVAKRLAVEPEEETAEDATPLRTKRTRLSRASREGDNHNEDRDQSDIVQVLDSMPQRPSTPATQHQSSPRRAAGLRSSSRISKSTQQPTIDLEMDGEDETSAASLAVQDQWARRREKALALTEELKSAEDFVVPEGASRLVCAFQEKPGNLVLSADGSNLKFVALGADVDTPMCKMEIVNIERDPTISPRKANPMTIRFRVLNGSGGTDLASFIVPQTDEGYAAMTAFRQKLVEARTALITAGLLADLPNIDPDDLPAPKEKPFKCETCSNTFKNKNGLEYHVQKSQTTCNPNFDADAAARVAQRKEENAQAKIARAKRKAARLALEEEAERTGLVGQPRRKKRKLNTREDVPSKTQRGGGNDDSDSSEDSIFEWAAQVANTRTRASGLDRPGRKTYRAFGGEIEYLTQLAESLIDQRSSEEVEKIPQSSSDAPESSSAQVSKQLPEHPVGQADTSTASQSLPEPQSNKGDLTPEACENIILHLVQSNGGIFPGEKSLWFAFVAVWMKEYKTSTILPESKLCSTIVDDLLESKRLRKFEHNFRDRRSRDVTRVILMLPDDSKKEESFTQMRDAIKLFHPRCYVPEGYAPPVEVLSKLEYIAVRVRNPPKKAEHSPDNDGTRQNSSTDDERTEDSDEDEFVYGDARARRNANISKGVIAWHVRRREAGLEPPLTKKTLRRHARIAKLPGKEELTAAEKERQYLEEASNPAWAVAAPAYMQSSTSGCWKVKVAPLKQRKPMKERFHPAGFAEPIIFMQASTGAWNVRPFGHGVKPIYARPSRRAIGSKYVQYLGDGYRPILYPAKYQGYSPALGTKRALEDEEGVDDLDLSAANGRNSTPTQPGELAESHDEDFVPPAEEPQDDDDFEDSDTRDSESVATPRMSFLRAPNVRRQPNSTRPRRQTRNAKKHSENLDRESEGVGTPLADGEPEKLPEGSLLNPGLRTLPPTFGFVHNQLSTFDDSAEFQAFDSIKFVEPQHVGAEDVLDDGSWTVTSDRFQRLSKKYRRVTFDERQAFSVDTLPYSELLEDWKDGRHSKPEGVQALIKVAGHGKIARVKKLIPTRPMTAILADFHGIAEDATAAAKLLGVEVYIPPSGEYQRKRIRLGNRMSSEEEIRFLITVVVVRILVGGIDMFIDWVIVQTQFPQFSMNHLHKVWLNIYTKKADLIDELGVDFQDAFLVAYQNGEVPPINYDTLLDYPWGKVIKWTMKNIDVSLKPKTYQLTAAKKDMKKEYYCNEIERNNGESQSIFFGLHHAIYRRMDAAGSRANAMPVDEPERPSAEDIMGEFALIKSWARATALTPMELWSQKFAFNKLSRFTNAQLQNAIDALIEEKVVIRRPRGKSTTGRSFEGSEAFTSPLRRPIAASQFTEALAYKEWLDSEFRTGRDMIMVDYMGDEGSYMCISSLHASGQLHLTYINIPNDPMGMGDDAHPYDTKRIPKEKIKWDIEMRMTPSYIFNDEHHILETIRSTPPPRTPDSEVIPAWYTIANELYPDMWKRILVAVAITVTLRTGISNELIKMLFTPTLETWEVDILMTWGEERGLWEKADEDGEEDGGEVNGWVASRDWWLLVAIVVREMETLSEQIKEAYEERQKRRRRTGEGPEDGEDDGDDIEMDDVEVEEEENDAEDVIETPGDQLEEDDDDE